MRSPSNSLVPNALVPDRLVRSVVLSVLLCWLLGIGTSNGWTQEEPPVEPFRITGVEIMAEGDGAVVRISGDGSLVWSRVHKVEDLLLAVVVPDATLPLPIETQGQHPLIVKAQSGPSPAGRRQAAMVAVRLSRPVHHVLDVEDGELLLRLKPRADAPAPATSPDVSQPGSSTSPGTLGVHSDSLGLAGAELLVLDESIGTAARPFLGPSPEGSPASSLQGVERRELEGRRGFFLRGDGDFGYSCFFLPNPDRFVVDLSGVRNVGGPKGMVVEDDPLVVRVRTSQFQRLPEPITRVVFDLGTRGKVRTLRTNEGLLLLFE